MNPESLTSSKAAAPLKGTARIPGDKSMSHRALMFGMLAQGETMVSGLLEAEDVLATAAACRALGARISGGHDGLWRIHGAGLGSLKEPASVLDMGNSGTSTRLLAGIIAGHRISAVMTGDASLIKRPMLRIIDPLTQMGAQFISREGGRLPMAIKGAMNARAIEYRLPVPSAQVKSAILLAGLNATGTTTVIEDQPTRDHTENMLRHFGVPVQVETLESGAQAIIVEGFHRPQGCAIDVPGDPSSAAFAAVAAALVEGSQVTLPHIGINPRRIGLFTTLQEMGADVTFHRERIECGERVADIVITGHNRLKGIHVPPGRAPSMIDEFPVLAMAAACAEGTTRMTGLAELRVKESDRLQMIADGLAACGAEVEAGDDYLVIRGTGKPPKGGALVETALDHRIAMSFLVLGMVTAEPVRVDDGSPIRTSFPDFAALMNDLGASIGSSGDAARRFAS
jgi:3-phosphoshikimate 1-carboxyvinyltransferase